MPELPITLEYDLSRRQRLIPHLRSWGPYQAVGILVFAAVTAAASRLSLWALFAWILFMFALRGYFIGLFNVLFIASQRMDVRIEANGLGYLFGKERYYVCLDGLTAVRDLERSVWTIQHWNGTVINVPKELLAAETLAFLRDWVQRANEIREKHGIRNPYPSEPASPITK